LCSRALRRLKETPGVHQTVGTADGIKAQRLPEGLVDELLAILAAEISRPRHP
jgi:hypothetical protein